MRRRTWSLIALAAALALPGCGDGSSKPTTNVVLIVIDTLRADRLSCQGWDRETSPTIDALAASGARMARHHCQCSWTQPSVVSMMTGRYVTDYRDTYPEDAQVLAETMQRAGYRTIGVVSNVLVSPEAGFGAGFDHFDARQLTKEEREARAAAGGSPGPCRDAPEMLDELLGEVDAHLASDDESPMFLYWHLMEPHAPYLAHADLAATFPLREDLPSAWHRTTYDARANVSDDAEAAAWKLMNSGRTRYEREIRKADDAVAQLLAALEERDLRDDTIFVIASDHGESLWDHPTLKLPGELDDAPPNRFFHQEHAMLMYQGLVNTPCIMSGPGVPAGTVIEENTENVDLYPTILELLDLPGPPRLHGESLVPIWAGEPQRNGDAHAYVLHNMMVHEAETGLKLIVPTYAGESVGGRPMLFDMQTDRSEQRDLAPEREADRTRLYGKLQQWVERHPTDSLIRVKSKQELAHLADMGYTGDDEDVDDAGTSEKE